MPTSKWWKKALVYQIYPLSFCDASGDGIGDLLGIESKLPYLKDLGVDVIWLSPVYRSPMDDNGYDISDYYDIDPLFGTMADFRRLLAKTHQLGMRLVMDLVVNHTSDQHAWFLEAKKSKDNPFRDFYVWRDEPTDITSVFSGSAWELDPATRQYYFHLFSVRQPDLNWDNPMLREAIYKMINFWLVLGIDGFRLDVIDLIGKDIDSRRLCDGPHLDARLRELYDRCFRGRDLMTVGETPCLSIDRVKDVTGGEVPPLDMVFQFGHLSLDEVRGQGKWELRKLNLVELKNHFARLQNGLYQQGWNSLFWANHDQPRAVSRYGDEAYRFESATMLATVLYGMQGTPFVYQGEELGMTGIRFSELAEYRDIETKNMISEKLAAEWPLAKIKAAVYAKSRDNSRTPMQWDDSRFAGFSRHEPWIPVNPNHEEINAESELRDPGSVLAYYRNLFAIRKQMEVFTSGAFELVFEDDPNLFAYFRKSEGDTVFVIGSFTRRSVLVNLGFLAPGKWLLANQTTPDIGEKAGLPPYFCGIYQYTMKGE